MGMYVKLRGHKMGPLEESQITTMIQQGKLGRFNEISTDGVHWKPISEYGSFFQTRSRDDSGLTIVEDRGHASQAAFSRDDSGGSGGQSPFQAESMSFPGSAPGDFSSSFTDPFGSSASESANSTSNFQPGSETNFQSGFSAGTDPGSFFSPAQKKTAPGSEQNFSGDFSSTPAETVSAGAKWYVSNNGVTGTGPFTDSEIREQLKNGRINEESLIWQEGGAALPIRKVPEFSSGDKEDPADDPFSKKKGKNPGTENQSAFNIEGENSDEEESWDRKKRRSRVPTEPTPMYCKSCHLKFAEGHVTCPECNAILFEIPPKSRLVYVTLACLPTGGLGIHNFYAVHYTRAKIQMLMGLTAVCFPITWIWAIAEAVFLQTDGNGAHFRL